MPFKFIFYPDPSDSLVTLKSDSGFVGTSIPYTDPPTSRKGQQISIPDSVPSEHGAELTLSKNGFDNDVSRGFLVLRNDGLARFQLDDKKLKSSTPVVPPVIPPNPNADPFAIIQRVFNETHPNLATEPGCGKFTEDCCEALHNEMNRAWGHVAKTSGQMQWNGHAIDAIMLLVPSGSTTPGIYDIIQSSLGPDAKPAFNLVDQANPSLWYYPPASLASTVIHGQKK